MSWAAAAVGATVLGGLISGQQGAAAQSAANRANVAMTKEQIAEQARQFDVSQLEGERRYGQEYGREAQRYADQYGAQGLSQSRRDYGQQQLGQYTGAGQAASKQSAALMGLGTPEEQSAAMAGFQDSPGQKFMRDRAQKNLLRSSAAIGGLGGGNVRSALVEQGAGFAGQDYNNYLRNLQTTAGQGLSAGQSLTSRDTGVLGGGQLGAQIGQPGGDVRAGGPGGQPGMIQPGGPNLNMQGPQGGPANEGTLTRINREKAAALATQPAPAATGPTTQQIRAKKGRDERLRLSQMQTI